MSQPGFSDVEHRPHRRKTNREEFLRVMDEIIPWNEWLASIEPHYPKSQRGRPPNGIEKMLRLYLLQRWYALSDEEVADAIYDSYAMRSFMQINFEAEQVPDAAALRNFRYLLEKHNIEEVLKWAHPVKEFFARE